MKFTLCLNQSSSASRAPFSKREKKDRDPFLDDVFGHTEDDVYVKGLCDAEDEQEFRVLLD